MPLISDCLQQSDPSYLELDACPLFDGQWLDAMHVVVITTAFIGASASRLYGPKHARAFGSVVCGLKGPRVDRRLPGYNKPPLGYASAYHFHSQENKWPAELVIGTKWRVTFCLEVINITEEGTR